MSKKLFEPRNLLTGLISVFGLLISVQSFAEVTVRGEPLRATELQILPPVCKLILVDNPMAHLSGGYGPLTQDAPLFEEPRYQLAKNNIHVHHYCWALVSKQRYFHERDPNHRKTYLSLFIGDIDYVLKHSDKNWPYMDMMLVEQGQMYAILGNFPAAIAKANEALRFKPTSEIAYVLKTDAYKNMGNKTAAIAAGREGLEKNPDSTRLHKRLTRLGYKPPPLAERKPPPAAENASVKESTSPDSAPASSSSATSPGASESTASEKVPPVPETIGTKNNPYCRFCP